jgi:hypothetical protein
MRSLIRRAAVVVLGLAVGVAAGLMSAFPASATPVTGPATNGTYLVRWPRTFTGLVMRL